MVWWQPTAAGLRPELVPIVEVEKVLPTASTPAVLELEDDAAVGIQALAYSLPAVVMKADHAPAIICKHVPQFGLEGASRLLPQPAEVGKDRLAALVVASERAPPRRVPRGALVEDLGERLHVGRVEGLVTAADDLGVPVHISLPMRLHRPKLTDGLSSDTVAGATAIPRPSPGVCTFPLAQFRA